MFDFEPGELIVIAGRPSMGKTVLAMNILSEYAFNNTKKAAIHLSACETDKSLNLKFISSIGRIPFKNLYEDCLSSDERCLKGSAQAQINDTKLHCSNIAFYSAQDICDMLMAFKDPMGLIVIDNLQMLSPTNERSTITEEYEDSVRVLKSVALKLNTPIILIAGVNRECEKRPNKRPMLKDIRGTGAIEDIADTVIFVYRDEFYYEDSPEKKLIEIILAKHKYKPLQTKMVYDNLKYNSLLLLFSNI